MCGPMVIPSRDYASHDGGSVSLCDVDFEEVPSPC